MIVSATERFPGLILGPFTHKCDHKTYCAKHANPHPHALDPMQCIGGWRRATEMEMIRKGNCHVCGMEQGPSANPLHEPKTPSTFGEPSTGEKS